MLGGESLNSSGGEINFTADIVRLGPRLATNVSRRESVQAPPLSNVSETSLFSQVADQVILVENVSVLQHGTFNRDFLFKLSCGVYLLHSATVARD